MSDRILVVEDDPDGQVFVSTVLEHMQIPHDLAGNAEQAEQYLAQQPEAYRAAIIDLALPGKDGWALLEVIKSNPRTQHLPCIAVTAYHSSKIREDALKAGFEAYFPKPLDATSFARQLESVI